MLHKSETFDKFKEFHAEVERKLGKQIKTLRSDRVGEYLSDQFQAYLVEHGILTRLTAPGTPQQNGVAERRNRTHGSVHDELYNSPNILLGTWSSNSVLYPESSSIYGLKAKRKRSVDCIDPFMG